MAAVRVAFGKWDGRRHWEYDAVRLGADRHGTWLGAPAGTPLARPGAAMTTGYDHIALVPHAAFVASFYEPVPAAPLSIYVDITTTAMGRAGLVRDRRGRVFVDDEDEFAEHRVRFGYPDDVAQLALRTCADVLPAVEAEEPPFDGPTADHWLAVLASRP